MVEYCSGFDWAVNLESYDTRNDRFDPFNDER